MSTRVAEKLPSGSNLVAQFCASDVNSCATRVVFICPSLVVIAMDNSLFFSAYAMMRKIAFTHVCRAQCCFGQFYSGQMLLWPMLFRPVLPRPIVTQAIFLCCHLDQFFSVTKVNFLLATRFSSTVAHFRGFVWACSPDPSLLLTSPPDHLKFRSFFSLSGHNFHSFFPLLGSSRGILVVF